jgi:hypothetical protein
MNEQMLAFFDRLDEEMRPFVQKGARLDMYLLGRAALVLHYRFALTTKDIDIVEMRDSVLEGKALELFGKDTGLAKALGFYLEQVPQGLPPLPSGFQNRCEEMKGNWKVLRLWVLEAHDLAVTKLKSFRPKDREDLQLLCDRGLLNVATLHTRLQAAFPFRSPKPDDAEGDADNPDWTKALNSLKRVEAYLKGAIHSL